MSQEFEGQEISEYIAAIPAMKLEAPDSYQRGTYLTLQVEVRVRSVRYEEITSGKRKGDLQKVHVLAVENVNVTGTVTPQQHQAMLAAAEAQLSAPAAEVVVEDGSSLEPVAAVLPQPVDSDQATPDTLTTAAAADEAEDGWVYESPEYVRVEAETAGVGF